MNPALLRTRLATRPGPAPELDELSVEMDTWLRELEPDTKLVPAAVLIALTQGREPGILLTKRTSHLNKHPGQVAFPGGRIDPTDPTPEAAALREAQEEIGLNPAHAELTGRLPDLLTGTGYRITPILALLPEGHDLADLGLTPSPHEVETIFQLPLETLLDRTAPQRKTRLWRGRNRAYWEWPHPEHHIWGATAAMLVTLADLLRSNP